MKRDAFPGTHVSNLGPAGAERSPLRPKRRRTHSGFGKRLGSLVLAAYPVCVGAATVFVCGAGAIPQPPQLRIGVMGSLPFFFFLSKFSICFFFFRVFQCFLYFFMF